jgi:hypothetical protein
MSQRTTRRTMRHVAVATATVGLLGTVAGIGGIGGFAGASSHREAPLISANPQDDNTDLYAFVSPDNHNTVTLIANWIPFEEPNGGPNFYPWATHTHYDVNIDNDGDGMPDITYRWMFHTRDARGSQPGGGTFLYDNGPVSTLHDPNLLFRQTYNLFEIRNGHKTRLLKNVPAAPSDTGVASMPNYGNLRNAAITSVPGGGKTVAAQSADPFFLDLRVFDLLYGGNFSEAGHNTLAGYNVNFVALQVPKSDLAIGHNPTNNPVIGVWSTTETRSLSLSPAKAKPTGKYVQVSRLGNPLVNEVVVPSQLKDAFNAIPPVVDHTVSAVVNKVLNPEVPKLIQAIYGLPAPATPRTDLAEIFLSGICKSKTACFGHPINADLNSQSINKAGLKGKHFVPAEELRLNMSIPVTADPNRLGVLGGDFQGFPNGRRLTDDVIDIGVAALEGAARTGMIPPALQNGDGVNSVPSYNTITNTFPYTPLPNTASVNDQPS